MGLKEWLSLDFAKRSDANDPPSSTPSRKTSFARPPRPSAAPTQQQQRRTSDARGSYYQTPRHVQQGQQQPEQFAEFSVDRRSEYAPRQQPPRPPASTTSASYRTSNQEPEFYPQETLASLAERQRRDHQPGGDRPYQSESGYYFEENGVDVEDDRRSVHDRRSSRLPRDNHRRSTHENQHERARQSLTRRSIEEGEPIVVQGLERNMAPHFQPPTSQSPPNQMPPKISRKDRRSSASRKQSLPPHDEAEEHHRNSIFDAIRFSWLGLGRSDSTANREDTRLSQLAIQTPRRQSIQQRRSLDEEAEIVMQGWLEKCGQQFKTWNWRYFVLRADGFLAYYADEQMKKLKGSINVGYGSKADISMQSHMIEKKNVFMIASEQRNTMISAHSQKVMTKWIAKLHAAGATPSQPWDPSQKVVNFFVRDAECPHEWKRYDDPTSYIHMEGCLMKRGHVNKNWKNRFFRIERGELRYYTEGQEQMKGSVNLKGTIVSPGMTQSPDGHKNYFVLTSKDGKFEMHLTAPNEQAMHRWIEALQEAQTALGGKGAKDTVSGLALVVKHAEEIPLAKEEVVYEAPELINVELERRMEALIVVSCRAGTVPVGSQLITVGGRSILRESYAASRHALRAAMCPLRLHFLVPPYKKGELVKKSRSGFENWKRRIVVVTNGEIQYYKEVASSSDQKKLKHRKTFPLYGCYLNLIQMPGREFCIIVARSPTDKLVLEARNEDERIEWASVIYCTIRMVSQGVTPGHIANLQLEVARDQSKLSPSDLDDGLKQDAPLKY